MPESKSTEAPSTPRRLTITLPGGTPYGHAEACQFTNGTIGACWTDPPQFDVWRDLDALREQFPDAELTYLDGDTAREPVFVAEVIWFGDNPVDGRQRVAVCASLDDAVTVLREDDSAHPDLVATEVTDSALGSKTARTWAVHERGTEPDDEGHMWITQEPLQSTGGTDG